MRTHSISEDKGNIEDQLRSNAQTLYCHLLAEE